eukprot:5252990-Alexandrium_andersonii.AAC.1
MLPGPGGPHQRGEQAQCHGGRRAGGGQRDGSLEEGSRGRRRGGRLGLVVQGGGAGPLRGCGLAAGFGAGQGLSLIHI